MATNEEIAETLEELAEFLQSRGELVFKIRSYRKAAATVRGLAVPLERYRLEHDLRKIPGVGEAIAKKIADMIDLGPANWLAAYRASKNAG